MNPIEFEAKAIKLKISTKRLFQLRKIFRLLTNAECSGNPLARQTLPYEYGGARNLFIYYI